MDCRTSRGEYGPTCVTIGRRSSGGVFKLEISRTPVSAMYKRARNWRGGQRQHIHFGAEFLEMLLVRHAETLFFVNHDQTQILEFHIRRDQTMRADDDVNFAECKLQQNFGLLARRAEARKHFHFDRIRRKPLRECLKMLLRENGGRHKHSRLPAAHHRLERGAQGNFCFSITHITAQQTIHRTGAFHVTFDICDGGLLVIGFDVGKTIFQFFLPLRIRREGIAFHNLTARIQIQQIFGDSLHSFFDTRLRLAPSLSAEMIERRLAAIRADVTRESVRLMHGDKERVGVVILNGKILPFVTVQLSLSQTREASDAVIHMHHIIADQQIRIK